MAEQTCSFYKKGPTGLFKKPEPDKCSALTTNIPEGRIDKFCRGDFFECEIFQNAMQRNDKKG